MAIKLNPYLSFSGNAREAMEFYADVLGGELSVSTFGEYGDDVPDPDQVMHAAIEDADGNVLMASDLPPGMGAPGGTTYVSLSGDDAERLREQWGRLSEDGQVVMPLEHQVWGDDYGMCIDRFGTGWHVNIVGTASA